MRGVTEGKEFFSRKGAKARRSEGAKEVAQKGISILRCVYLVASTFVPLREKLLV